MSFSLCKKPFNRHPCSRMICVIAAIDWVIIVENLGSFPCSLRGDTPRPFREFQQHACDRVPLAVGFEQPTPLPAAGVNIENVTVLNDLNTRLPQPASDLV